MSEWLYRVRELARLSRIWLVDHARLAAMVAALSTCMLIYLVFFLESPFKTRDMVILHRPAPQWNSVVFSLDRDYPVRRIEVVALDAEGKPSETIWRLKRVNDAELSTFAYAQNLPGMEIRVNPAPLQEGPTYRLIVNAPGARGQTDFTFSTQPTNRRGG